MEALSKVTATLDSTAATLGKVSAQQAAASDQLLHVPEAALRTSDKDDRYEDKVNAISGIDFKQKHPEGAYPS